MTSHGEQNLNQNILEQLDDRVLVNIFKHLRFDRTDDRELMKKVVRILIARKKMDSLFDRFYN